MKKLLNTLYVTSDNAYLRREDETFIIEKDGEKIGQIPAHAVQNILCFGYAGASPGVLTLCSEKAIGFAFYNPYGKFVGRFHGKQTGNVLLRKQQYRLSDSVEQSALLAKSFILAKIANSRSVLQRALRNRGENQTVSAVIERLAHSLKVLQNEMNLEVIRGIEGAAAADYFSVFNFLITNENFTFEKRVRRPATDPINALLSFCYTLLGHDIASALEGVGLDPYVGFLHRDRPGRISLALDMLEELRAKYADRFVLNLINRKQLKPADFITEVSGAVRLKDDARKLLFTELQNTKQEEIIHPFTGEKTPIGLLPHIQSMLLARHIRGETEFYPPFVAKG